MDELSLNAYIQAQLDTLDAKTAFFARHPVSTKTIAIRADDPVNTLSVIKIAIMVLAYRDAEAGTFDLDTHGFVFVEHQTKMRDFADEAERSRVYNPEVEALIKKHSGAAEVVVFDHTIRIGDEQAQAATGARPPVKGVHNDYTEASAPRRLQEIVGAEVNVGAPGTHSWPYWQREMRRIWPALMASLQAPAPP